MDKKELSEKFCSLLNEVKNSDDKEDMEVCLHMFKKAMNTVSELNMRSYKELVECFEGNLKFYNFLTENEASEILEKFVNQDGSRGAKWKDSDELFHKVEEMNGKIVCEPHYNKWALYVAMNMAASDQNSIIRKWVGDDTDKYAEVCYELALSHLKDKDRLNWIRPFYGLGD